MHRFRDQRLSIDHFRDEYLVYCPRCHGCASVRLLDPQQTNLFAPRRFSCLACGATKDWAGEVVGRQQETVDDYFHYRLWLQIPCCGHVFWANNLRHLNFLEAFVAAKVRESHPDPQTGWANRSLYSRLPQWLQASKNRDQTLRAIAKLRRML